MGQVRLPQRLAREFPGPEWYWLRAGWRDFMKDNLHNPVAAPWLFHYLAAAREQGEGADVLSPKQAAKQLRMKVGTVKRLIEKGIVQAIVYTPEPSSGKSDMAGPGQGQEPGQEQTGITRLRSPKRITLISTAVMVRLRKLRTSQLSLIQTSRYLGINEQVVRDLMRRSLLVANKALDAQRHWISMDNIDKFLYRVLEPCTIREQPEGANAHIAASLARAVDHGTNQARLLSALAGGELKGYRKGEANVLSDIWFYRHDVQQFLWRAPTEDGRVLVVRSEAMRILRCRPAAFRRWQEVGLLVPVVEDPKRRRAAWRYDQNDLETFRERYIGSVEAAEILQCTTSTLGELAWRGNIPASCITYTPDAEYGLWLFNRAALENWIADRITCDEAAQLLGVHLNTIREWADAGRLSRVSKIWYSREQVLTWRDDMVRTKEAAELLGVSLPTMFKWVRLGYFEPVAVVGKNDKWWYFSKRLLTRWRSERMDAKQVMAVFNISRPTVYYWHSIGRIRHLDDVFAEKLWFASVDITKLREHMNIDHKEQYLDSVVDPASSRHA